MSINDYRALFKDVNGDGYIRTENAYTATRPQLNKALAYADKRIMQKILDPSKPPSIEYWKNYKKRINGIIRKREQDGIEYTETKRSK